MGFAQNILDRVNRPAGLEKRAEWGSSAVPGPLANGSGGSYATVNLAKLENNFQQVAVWGAIDLIASVAAQLPIDTFKGRKNLGNPKVIEDPAGDGYGASDWVYQYLVSKLARGNAVGKQTFDPTSGYPTQTVLYHPDTVRGERDRVTGQARWWVENREVSTLWHRRSYPMPGCLMGLSPLTIHMTTIGLGVASTRFGAQFFTDSAIPSALLTNEEAEIDQGQAAEVKARWMAAVWGTREPAVFGKGWNYETISLAPEESQFLETNKYTQAQCARIFGPNVAEILGYETGGSMTYANVVDRSMDFLKYTLNRHLRDLETTMTMWLPRGQFVKINRGALLETDLLSRFKAYGMAIGGHYLAPSEAREFEDWEPMTDEQKKELEGMPMPTNEPLKESPK
jgi:HK97 family phage portal protein